MRLVVSHAARDDLKAIARHTQREWGAARKTRYMQALREGFRALLRHPERGAERADIGPFHRALPVGSHVIFYRRAKADIFIVRVLHQRMDVRRRL